MSKVKSDLEKDHAEQGQRKIDKIKKKIDITKHNMEVSKEIIAETPSPSQKKKLQEQMSTRAHAIGSMNKEIRDIEQTIEERSREP